MQRFLLTVSVVIAALGIAVLSVSTLARSADADAGRLAAPVATVDFQRVIDEMKEFNEKDAIRTARGRQLEAQLQKVVDQLESAQAQRELIPESNIQARRQATAELLQLEAKLNGDRQVYSTLINYELGDLLRDAHEKASAAINSIAQEAGYDIVLSDDRLGALPPVSADRLQQIIGSQRVFYVANPVDITDAVINRLDAEYAAGR